MKKLGINTPSNITKRLHQLDELQNCIADILSIPANDIKIWPVISEQKLILFTDNPILATQIKYQQEEICNRLNSIYKTDIRRAHTKLIPTKIASPRNKNIPNRIGEASSKALNSIADGIDDLELKQLLKRISNNED